MRKITKEEFKAGVKKHKRKIIIGGSLVVAAVAGGIIVYKKPDIILQAKKLINSSNYPVSDAKDVVEIVTTPIKTPPAITSSLYANEQLAQRVIEMADTTRKLTEPFTVSAFVRNLPVGQSASATAIQNALDAGITLGEGQTYVMEYIKRLPPVA